MIDIDIADQQSTLDVDEARLEQAARSILIDHGPATARLSIAIVDDLTIHQLNRQFLQHDYPTDVLSFALEERSDSIEGEVVVSADRAVAQAGAYRVRPEQELLLYVIHGVLHLVGFDDETVESRQHMRSAEQDYLRRFGGVMNE